MDILEKFYDLYAIEITGGLFASLILLLSVKAYEAYKNILNTHKYSGYIGSYFVYSHSVLGGDDIVTYNLEIKKSLTGKLYVKASCFDLHYTGTLSINERNIYINLTGENHTEEMHMVFYSPLNKKIRKLCGIHSLISLIDEPVGKVCIVSDVEMDGEEVRKYIKRSGYEYPYTSLRIKKDFYVYSENTDGNYEEYLRRLD